MEKNTHEKEHQTYKSQKLEYAYKLSLQGKYFEKARAICFDKETKQIYFIYNSRNKGWTIPGGGVEQNESVEDAAIRELYEEAGIKGKNLGCFGKCFYDVNMQYKGKPFVSKRVEYYFLFEFVSKEEGHKGLDGEFGSCITMMWDNFDTLNKTSVSKEVVEKLIQTILSY